ncbi:prolactin-releasing peptide receptor [Eurosta solidaginis]|uniref:prolactin-releasing peptide receptor n=1 Tax=Eurosta solidaginis TaxID=178769 RepID=UPI00353084DD
MTTTTPIEITNMSKAQALSSYTSKTATIWRRRSTPTISSTITAKTLCSSSTLIVGMLVFNIISAAIAVTTAVTLKTTQASTTTRATTLNGTHKHDESIIMRVRDALDTAAKAANATTTTTASAKFTTDTFVVATTLHATVSDSSSSSGATSSSAYARVSGNFELYEEEQNKDLIHNKLVQIIFCIIYLTVFALGVFGNVLVCYVVLRNRAMQTVTNYFITNLALSDILLCVLAVPFTPLYTFMGRWAFGHTLCHLVSFAQGCSIYISTLTLMSIAIDRVCVIVYPFRPRMKLSTCKSIIVIIWVFSLLFTTPYGIFMKMGDMELSNKNESLILSTNKTVVDVNDSSTIAYGAYVISPALTTVANVGLETSTNPSYAAESTSDTSTTIHYCEENWPSETFRKVFGFVTTTLQFGIPLAVITVCYIWVSIKLNMRERSKPGSKSLRREEADRERKRRTNYMLIAMVLVFAISWLPLNLVNMMDDFYEKSNEWQFYTFFFFIAHSIAMSSICYNPFLYAWLNENFRKEFKHVLPCFNPSNNNLSTRRGFNRSDRNTCGPRLHHGNGCGMGSMDVDDGDENGITQETSLAKPKYKLTIIPREPTYGNDSGCGSILSPNRGLNSALVHNSHVVDIMLNDKAKYLSNKNAMDDDCVSSDEQTIEMRFSETPFVSSDTTTAVSMVETGSSCNEVGERGCN